MMTMMTIVLLLHRETKAQTRSGGVSIEEIGLNRDTLTWCGRFASGIIDLSAIIQLIATTCLQTHRYTDYRHRH